MNTNEKMRNLDEDYIIAFRNILKEAERMEREAMDRFHSWSNRRICSSENILKPLGVDGPKDVLSFGLLYCTLLKKMG